MSGYTWEQFTAEMSVRVAAPPLDRYPIMRRMLPMLLGHHSNQPFEYGLDALIDGLELRRRAAGESSGAPDLTTGNFATASQTQSAGSHSEER
jgi:hypothetical protein